jgi:flagellar hook-associated protein 2
MTLDSNALTNALQQNPSAVQNLFGGTSGIGAQLDTLLNNYAGPTGVISGQTSVLNTQVSDITSQLSALNTQSAQLTQQYLAEYNAMDSVVQGYKNTSALLTQLYTPNTNSNGSSSSSG